MKNRYEALLVLNTQGKEDTVKDIVDRLESEFQKEGAEIEQVQKMDKRQFSYRRRRARRGLLRELHLSRRPAADHQAALEIQARSRKFIASITSGCGENRRSRTKKSRRSEVIPLERRHGQFQ